MIVRSLWTFIPSPARDGGVVTMRVSPGIMTPDLAEDNTVLGCQYTSWLESVWWWRGVTRMSSPQPRVKCTHVQWAPGETRRGQNVKYSPGILSKSPQPNTCHSWFLIKHHVLTRILYKGMYPAIMTLRRVSGASQDHNFYPLMTGRVSDGVWFLWL